MSDALRADCSRCAGLCCVVLAFSRSADFAIDKDAGEPCPNLNDDFGCAIHSRLRERGFAGCTVYDCFGAGQHVTQVTFGGRTWRSNPEIAPQAFTAFRIVRHLNELRWYLREALALADDEPLRAEIESALRETERLADQDAGTLAEVDLPVHRERVVPLLLRVSQQVRAGWSRPEIELPGADLAGRDLRDRDLRGANLRGALLVGANLTGADLRMADLIGADLRRTRLHGADLTGSIFLAQSQVDAAAGDAHTMLPAPLTRPSHWA